MEATRRVLRRRRPLSDCSNVVGKSTKLDSAAGGFLVNKSVAASPVVAVKVENRGRRLISPGKTKYGVGSGKENAGEKGIKEEEDEGVDVESVLLSTPPVPVGKLDSQVANRSVDPMTIYSRRRVSKKIFGSSSCPPPAEKKRDKLSEEDDGSMLKWNTEPSKKKRSLPMDLISQDFIERQRAYFQEIDRFELPEEEVSESSDNE
uniref:Sororin C-terminal region domain-containing protein n=1 Tax=Kalanchoe fedtschenkoi TaxID=63787 RepID=A0A7N0R9R6_KALFE